MAKVDSDKTSKIVYNDYGSTTNIKAGHGYNGDMLDSTGLIYLRARYYDPSVSRFIQIDNNYEGEKQSVSSQNRYVYTLNNPYKYVDKDGNKSTKKKPKVKEHVVDVEMMRVSNGVYQTYIYSNGRRETTFRPNNVKVQPVYAPGGKIHSPNGDNNSKKPTKEKQKPKVKCASKDKAFSSTSILNNIQKVLDYIGWLPTPVGDIADGINALISFIRGDVLMAIINIACLALPAAIMAGAKAIGKTCRNAVEFISKLSPGAQKMVKTVTGFVTWIRDGIGKIKWLLGEKIIRPVMNKLDDLAKWIDNIFAQASEKVAKEGASGRTFKSSYDIPVDEKGYTKSSLSLGQKVHKEYKINNFDNISKYKEYRLPSGKRIDYIDFDTKIIYELKPNNPTQIKLGTQQLQGYLEEVESFAGKGWKIVLDTY